MIDDELQRQWLEAVVNDLDVPFFTGPRIPEFGRGDVLGVCTPTAGPGPVLEGIDTVVGFQIRMVARLHAYAQLKLSAWQIHKALLFADVPADLWGTRVVWVNAVAGDPVPEPADGVDKDRVAFTCSYVSEVTL